MDINKSVRFRRLYAGTGIGDRKRTDNVAYRIRDSSSSGSFGMAPCCVQT